MTRFQPIIFTLLSSLFVQAANSLVLLAPPSSHFDLYDDVRSELFDFYANFHQAATSVGERVLLVATNEARQGVDNGAYAELTSRGIPEADLLDFALEDIWARDFIPTQLSADLYARFAFQPAYLDYDTVYYINDTAAALLHDYLELEEEDDITYYDNIVLDGGSIAFVGDRNNEITMAVTTERVLRDNPDLAGRWEWGLGPAETCCPADPYDINNGDPYGQFTRDEIEAGERALEDALGIDQVAIVPEDSVSPRLGHIDGIANFLAPGVIALSNYSDTSVYNGYEQILKDKFGSDLTIVRFPFKRSPDTFTDGFESAEGIYVNFLRTHKALYIPQFGYPEDAEALKIARSHTRLPVVGVDASEVAIMGGSVRCLSQHLWGDFAEAFLGEPEN